MDDVPSSPSPVIRPPQTAHQVVDAKEIRAIKGMRVLVTEDNTVNQLVAEKMLKKLGCEVLIAKDGYEAIDKNRANMIDLIFMDLHMPILDGTEISRLKNCN